MTSRQPTWAAFRRPARVRQSVALIRWTRIDPGAHGSLNYEKNPAER